MNHALETEQEQALLRHCACSARDALTIVRQHLQSIPYMYSRFPHRTAEIMNMHKSMRRIDHIFCSRLTQCVALSDRLLHRAPIYNELTAMQDEIVAQMICLMSIIEAEIAFSTAR